MLENSINKTLKKAEKEWSIYDDYRSGYTEGCHCGHKKSINYLLYHTSKPRLFLYACIDCIKNMKVEKFDSQVKICDHKIHAKTIFDNLFLNSKIQFKSYPTKSFFELKYNALVLTGDSKDYIKACPIHNLRKQDVFISSEFDKQKMSISSNCLNDIGFDILYIEYKNNLDEFYEEEKRIQEENDKKNALKSMKQLSKDITKNTTGNPPSYTETEQVNKKKQIPAAVKRKVWAKHIGEDVGKTKCLCCKLTDISQMSFSCGHIISDAKGGKITIDNLKPICTSCNSSMGTKNMNEFIKEYGF